MSKAIIHIHQQRIRKGLAAIIVRTWWGSRRYRRVEINGPAVLVQSHTPDRCGARVWLETDTCYLTLPSTESDE